MAPNHDPDSWNYPYDHYKGFIAGSVDGGSYSQRVPRPQRPCPAKPDSTLNSPTHCALVMAGNTFLYPPQTATRCAENNATYHGTCGTMGAAKLFQADQTTEYCNQEDGGRISGPYGADSTITTLIGTQAVLYQIWSVDAGGDSVLYQSQMTTITHSADGQIRRTRTAQFFDKDSGEAAQFSFYRELKVDSLFFWTQFNETMVEYDVSRATISRSGAPVALATSSSSWRAPWTGTATSTLALSRRRPWSLVRSLFPCGPRRAWAAGRGSTPTTR